MTKNRKTHAAASPPEQVLRPQKRAGSSRQNQPKVDRDQPPRRRALRMREKPPEELPTPPKPADRQRKRVLCEICAEKRNIEVMFEVENCSHSFCFTCITKHIQAKIAADLVGQTINCPGGDCDGTLELQACKTVIPKDVYDRWDDKVTESLIGVSERFYCPFKDCSALLVNDGGAGGKIRESECPICRRLFCAQCRVPWHPETSCEDLQKLNLDERGKEDRMVKELAKKKKWMRCPNCKFYVERTYGCLHIYCRCGYDFCYACGKKWSATHEGGCRRGG